MGTFSRNYALQQITPTRPDSDYTHAPHTMSVRQEVQTAVFDPRHYKETDTQHWARRRKSDWLACPGTITITRTRTVPVDSPYEQRQREEANREREDNQMEGDEQPRENAKQKEIVIERSKPMKPVDNWPRRKRSDLIPAGW